ncbi:MAG: TolC family protein [Ignavibacteriales bacterium]|nr:TolC family protein [Ignavibacteriales bacterium]
MKRIWILIVGLSLVSNLLAQKTLTIDEAISIALQRNSNLIKGENLLTSSEANVKSAYGDLLPSLGLSGSWGWRRVADEGGQSQINFFGEEQITPATKTDTRSYSLSAGGNVVLFDGLANYAQISRAKNDLESSEFSLDKLRQDVVYTTTFYYYGVISTGELVKVRQDNVSYNEKLLETIKERNKLGSIPIADVYTQQVSVGNAQLLLIQAQNSYENAKNNLLNYLALDIFENYELVDPYTETSESENEEFLKNHSNLESLVKEALLNRKDYKSKLLDVESAQNGKTIAFSGMLPSLSGNYGYSTSATKPNSLFDRETYSVGLSLNIPIFSNWNTEANMQFAEVSYLNEMEDLAALERTIKIEVKDSYLNLVASKKQLEVTKSNVIAAKENRRVNHERYNLGSGTILDVLQSDKDYTQALTDNISAKFEYFQNRDKLINALGKLDFEKYQ